MPSRNPDEPVCKNYAKSGNCRVESEGRRCKFDHPPLTASKADGDRRSERNDAQPVGRSSEKRASAREPQSSRAAQNITQTQHVDTAAEEKVVRAPHENTTAEILHVFRRYGLFSDRGYFHTAASTDEYPSSISQGLKSAELSGELQAALEEHSQLATAAAKQRAEWGVPVPLEQALKQVPSSLAKLLLEKHVELCQINPPRDITSKEWTKMRSKTKKEKAANARIARSFDELMAPLLEHAGRAVGRVSVDIVGASEVSMQLLVPALCFPLSFSDPLTLYRCASCVSPRMGACL